MKTEWIIILLTLLGGCSSGQTSIEDLCKITKIVIDTPLGHEVPCYDGGGLMYFDVVNIGDTDIVLLHMMLMNEDRQHLNYTLNITLPDQDKRTFQQTFDQNLVGELMVMKITPYIQFENNTYACKGQTSTLTHIRECYS